MRYLVEPDYLHHRLAPCGDDEQLLISQLSMPQNPFDEIGKP